ncbi:MAG: FIST C-terminal domain-containing protein [Clostridiales Family XIII bacterium]|nr:FIST C-terminal domain-containing protein [Clostridiales Family XIII bacterium]
MVTMITAFTEEIDDIEAAVSEVLAQLDLENSLKAHSVGVLHCFVDFLESGVVEGLCAKLPFDVVGTTTLSVSTREGMSPLGLSIAVLTSDSVSFVTGASEPITGAVDGPIEELYGRLVSGLPEKPAMLMPFVPFLLNVCGDDFVEKLDSLSGGLPAFGTLAISRNLEEGRIFTIHNGSHYRDSLVLLALCGDVDPVFMSVSVTDENILKQKAMVTGVDRNVLSTVNNLPAVEYFESIGLASGGVMFNIQSMPLILYQEDGSTLIRACVSPAEGGSVILAGAANVNSTLALATMGMDDVIRSSGEKADETLKVAEGRGALIYSCVARRLVLGAKPMAEHEKLAERFGEAFPYSVAYSGGEIFPSILADGSAANHLQNDSLIICVI